MTEAFDEKYLEGLEMTGAERKVVDGKSVWVQWTRAMVPEDVLSYKETADEVVIVGNDGRKHVVPKIGNQVDVLAQLEVELDPISMAQHLGLNILPRDIPWNWTGCEDFISDGKTSCNPHMAVKKGGKRK